MILLMLGYGLVTSVYAVANPTLAGIVPPAQHTSVLAIGLALGGLLSVLGPWFAGMILDSARASGAPADGYTTLFMLMGAVVIVGGILFAVLANPERDAMKVEAARARLAGPAE